LQACEHDCHFFNVDTLSHIEIAGFPFVQHLRMVCSCANPVVGL
jgi:hypothetical protein